MSKVNVADVLPSKQNRNRLIAAVQLAWQGKRPDLSHPSDDSREQRLLFCRNVLNLKRLSSMKDLTDDQLRRVLGVLKSGGQMASGPQPAAAEATGGQVIHLASLPQAWAIDKIFTYLGWTDDGRRGFLKDRYRVSAAKLLRPDEANAVIRILLNIAASRDLKGGDKAKVISKDEIKAYLPELKSKIGIDRKGA